MTDGKTGWTYGGYQDTDPKAPYYRVTDTMGGTYAGSNPVYGTDSVPKQSFPEPDYVDELLKSRDGSHGSYNETARLIQSLKNTMHQERGWQDLNACQKEALDMIATKIGRILVGDQNFKDHYDDIAGYARLVADRCK